MRFLLCCLLRKVYTISDRSGKYVWITCCLLYNILQKRIIGIVEQISNSYKSHGSFLQWTRILWPRLNVLSCCDFRSPFSLYILLTHYPLFKITTWVTNARIILHYTFWHAWVNNDYVPFAKRHLRITFSTFRTNSNFPLVSTVAWFKITRFSVRKYSWHTIRFASEIMLLLSIVPANFHRLILLTSG